jgi:hypothetical protein
MTDRHADSRDRKRRNKRYGMKVNNKAAHLHQYIVNQRAAEERAKRMETAK